ncbi:1-phosphatidylinositol phosphodiesterase-like isoform X2 [Esox lucius]|uniref:Phosphatidylinositol-specific phospholipase C X domain-containing protein n=1 Tax=Esox lucius TaxID=8010 RepID=A0AAY5LDE9_ESOLU|nr:1-phosphatidylinositol phosphodiesterase-like isoform X2 [Esox lucius]
MKTTGRYLFAHLYMSVLHFESYKIGWMEAIDDAKFISDITIPGTHDTMALYGGPAAECQVWDLWDQLRAGIRYLDLRVVALENKLYVVHGIVNQHKSFFAVLNMIKGFLSEFRNETVLLRVKPELFGKNNVEKQVSKMINDDETVWVKSDMPTMGKVRGKVVFIQKSSFRLGVPLLETDNQGDYKVSLIADKEKKIGKHLRQASEQCGGNSVILSYSSGTGIGKPLTMHLTPKKLAVKINPWLAQYLGQFSIIHTKACLGVVAMDFPGIDLIQRLIKINH